MFGPKQRNVLNTKISMTENCCVFLLGLDKHPSNTFQIYFLLISSEGLPWWQCDLKCCH